MAKLIAKFAYYPPKLQAGTSRESAELAFLHGGCLGWCRWNDTSAAAGSADATTPQGDYSFVICDICIVELREQSAETAKTTAIQINNKDTENTVEKNNIDYSTNELNKNPQRWGLI